MSDYSGFKTHRHTRNEQRRTDSACWTDSASHKLLCTQNKGSAAVSLSCLQHWFTLRSTKRHILEIGLTPGWACSCRCSPVKWANGLSLCSTLLFGGCPSLTLVSVLKWHFISQTLHPLNVKQKNYIHSPVWFQKSLLASQETNETYALRTTRKLYPMHMIPTRK